MVLDFTQGLVTPDWTPECSQNPSSFDQELSQVARDRDLTKETVHQKNRKPEECFLAVGDIADTKKDLVPSFCQEGLTAPAGFKSICALCVQWLGIHKSKTAHSEGQIFSTSCIHSSTPHPFCGLLVFWHR